MFPNVRLMIAAMVASVVALSCGFGVFAAFRVNHEPLVRLPPAGAPLQLIGDNTITTASVLAVAAEPFDHRFPIGPPQSDGRATDPPTPELDDRGGIEAAPAASVAVPERDAAETKATTAAAPAVAAAPPTIALVANALAPAADGRPLLSATEPEPLPAAAHADAASPVQQTPAVAASQPPTGLALPAEQTKPASELAPAKVVTETTEAAHKPVRKAAVNRTRRTRVFAGAYRARRPRANAVAEFDRQYPNHDTAFTQPNFQTGLQAWQPRLAQGRRRAKDISRPPEDATAVAGLPFVGPLGR